MNSYSIYIYKKAVSITTRTTKGLTSHLPPAHRGLESCGGWQAVSGLCWASPYLHPTVAQWSLSQVKTGEAHPAPRQVLRPPCQHRGLGCQCFVILHNSATPMLPRKKFCVPHLSDPGPDSPPTLATCCPPAAQTSKPGTRCGVGPDAPSHPQGSGGLGSTRAHDLPLRGWV